VHAKTSTRKTASIAALRDFITKAGSALYATSALRARTAPAFPFPMESP
jgi:hypothetical protein